jgi:hypothetical protein
MLIPGRWILWFKNNYEPEQNTVFSQNPPLSALKDFWAQRSLAITKTPAQHLLIEHERSDQDEHPRCIIAASSGDSLEIHAWQAL